MQKMIGNLKVNSLLKAPDIQLTLDDHEAEILLHMIRNKLTHVQEQVRVLRAIQVKLDQQLKLSNSMMRKAEALQRAIMHPHIITPGDPNWRDIPQNE